MANPKQPQLFQASARPGLRSRGPGDGRHGVDEKEVDPDYDEEDSIDIRPQERDFKHKQAR